MIQGDFGQIALVLTTTATIEVCVDSCERVFGLTITTTTTTTPRVSQRNESKCWLCVCTVGGEEMVCDSTIYMDRGIGGDGCVLKWFNIKKDWGSTGNGVLSGC